MMIIGFDWDGTLVESWTGTPLPGVRERLVRQPADVKTFIATNQAGPVWRAVTREEKYPTVEDVANRIAGGLAVLQWHPDLLLICVHPGRMGLDWNPATQRVLVEMQAALNLLQVPAAVINDPFWRKPEPGMLHFAAGYLYNADDILYIGDMDTDEQAARSAGARYLDAARWRAGE